MVSKKSIETLSLNSKEKVERVIQYIMEKCDNAMLAEVYVLRKRILYTRVLYKKYRKIKMYLIKFYLF